MTDQERLVRREQRQVRATAARKRQKTATWLAVSAGAASFVLTLAAVHFTGILEPPPVPTAPAAMLGTTRPQSSIRTPATDPDRPNYRYSIVPGGVRSGEEVMAAILRDPVVAGHYANVVPANLRSERLTAPMSAHVSYRVGDKVYWTRKKLTLNAGEKVLTDGTTTMRERCGNIISMDPLAPALEGAEPTPPEFDLHVDPFVPTPGVELADPPVPPAFPYVHTFTPPGPAPALSGVPGLHTFTPPGPPRNTPPEDNPPTQFSATPTVVPEPSTWVLIATGLGFGAARLLRKRKKS